MVLKVGQNVLLIDPMVGPQGSMPTFTYVRFRARRNPTVPFPKTSQELLERVTHCLITHQHPDHLDPAGIQFLIDRKIPVSCSELDADDLRKKGIQVVQELAYGVRVPFLGGEIEGIPARHGYGYIAKPMGNVMGFYLELPGEPSIYLSSDTILTPEVSRVLQEYRPAISVVAAGSAQLDLFKPLLMRKQEVLRFIELAPQHVIANHLEAVNHCPTSRQELRRMVAARNWADRVWIPEDGDQKTY